MPKSRAAIKVHRRKEREEPGIYPIDILRSTWSSDEDQENAVGANEKPKSTKNIKLSKSVKSTKGGHKTNPCSTVEKLHKSMSFCLSRTKGANSGKTKRTKSSCCLKRSSNRHRRRVPQEPSVPKVYPIETILPYEDEDEYMESDETSGRIEGKNKSTVNTERNQRLKRKMKKKTEEKRTKKEKGLKGARPKLKKSTTKMASKKSIEIEVDVKHDLSFMESSEDELFPSANEGRDIKSSMSRHYRDDEDGARSTDFEYDTKGEPTPDIETSPECIGVLQSNANDTIIAMKPLNPLNRFGFGNGRISSRNRVRSHSRNQTKVKDPSHLTKATKVQSVKKPKIRAVALSDHEYDSDFPRRESRSDRARRHREWMFPKYDIRDVHSGMHSKVNDENLSDDSHHEDHDADGDDLHGDDEGDTTDNNNDDDDDDDDNDESVDSNNIDDC